MQTPQSEISMFMVLAFKLLNSKSMCGQIFRKVFFDRIKQKATVFYLPGKALYGYLADLKGWRVNGSLVVTLLNFVYCVSCYLQKRRVMNLSSEEY